MHSLMMPEQDEPPIAPLTGRQLYSIASDDSIDVKGELHRLSRELILLYGELLKVLVEDPDGYPVTLTALNQVFSNMQHLVNVLRPVQAACSLENALTCRIAGEPFNHFIDEAAVSKGPN